MADETTERGTGESFQALSARFSRVLGAATVSTLPTAIDLCLEEVGRFAGADAAFATLVDDDERVSDDWHWIRPGKTAAAPAVGSHLRDTFASATEFLRLGHTVPVDDLSRIELSPSEAAMAANNRLRSILLVPVCMGPTMLGVAGLLACDEPRAWSKAVIDQVELLSQLLVRAVIRTQNRGALAAADARARRIAEFIPDGLVLATTDGLVTWASPSFTRMSGLDVATVQGMRAVHLVHPDDRAAVTEQLQELTDVPIMTTVRVRSADGDWRWADLSVQLASDDESGVPDELVFSVRDAHERQLRVDQLARQSEVDSLTGLLNRSALTRRVSDLGDQGAWLTVAYCDIDNFKAVNDAHGHAAGDDALQRIAHAITSAIRDGDLVARLGGDEFVVMVVNPPDADRPAMLGERLVAAVGGAASGLDVTLSVGVAGPGPATEATELLRAADEAMYRAKAAGRNRFVTAG